MKIPGRGFVALQCVPGVHRRKEGAGGGFWQELCRRPEPPTCGIKATIMSGHDRKRRDTLMTRISGDGRSRPAFVTYLDHCMRELQINAASRVERSTRAESESRTRLQNIAALAEHLLQETKGALSDLDRTHHQSISDYQVGMGALKDVHDMISSPEQRGTMDRGVAAATARRAPEAQEDEAGESRGDGAATAGSERITVQELRHTLRRVDNVLAETTNTTPISRVRNHGSISSECSYGGARLEILSTRGSKPFF